MSEVILTYEGLKKLREELQNLYKERDEINKEIDEARQQGDLSENAGYQYAKEKQLLIFKRITEIESLIRNAKIIDTSQVSKDEVRIGAKVKLLDIETNKESIYTIVSLAESNPLEGKISANSPLAQGILGSKVGEEKIVKLPKGEKKFRIVSIEY
ncbi:MAG: transcription elongation factor GreA [Elusimicrobiales bacterium]|nr:transcription elongation factor GreA [Elusimicrobiales bacterium]